jgi:outer membrane lipoprotein-sorting protein
VTFPNLRRRHAVPAVTPGRRSSRAAPARRLAAFLGAAGLGAAGCAAPGLAAAQALSGSLVLEPGLRSTDASRLAAALPPASAFTLSPAPPAPHFRPVLPPRPAPAVAAGADREAVPTPPRRPQPPPAPAVAATPAAAPQSKPLVIAAAPRVAAVPRVERLSERAIVERANAYFTGLGGLTAAFTQIGGDGRRVTGTLYLQRPGKVRFAYDRPSTLEVIADGSSVAVRDTRLATQDLYAISQTPLKFLLRPEVNLGRDIRIVGAADEGDAVRLTLEDTSTLGGTSRITLFFDPKVEALTQWRILDPQGFQTTMLLDRVDRTRTLDPGLFAISYDRILSSDK